MSVKCREELNTNEKARVEEKEFCRSKNQRPSSTIYIPTQKTRIDEALPGNPQQTFTSTDMQPIHSKVILPNQDDLIKTNKEATRVELSTSDFSNSSGDFMASEDEPSSSSCMISPKQNRNNSYNNKRQQMRTLRERDPRNQRKLALEGHIRGAGPTKPTKSRFGGECKEDKLQ